MKLRKLNGRYQPIIEHSTDIFSILDVENQHWSANCSPVEGISADPDFLRFLDGDNNGRILPFEVREALRWLQNAVKDATGILQESDEIELAQFRSDTHLGKLLREAAEHVLENLAKDSPLIRLSDVRARTQILQAGAHNGDGVIPPNAITDPQLQQIAMDIITVMGGTKDINGQLGIDESTIVQFPEQAEKWLAWKTAEPQTRFASQSSQATVLIAQVQPAIDQFFSCCFMPPDPLPLDLMAKPNPQAVLHLNKWIAPKHRQSWKGFCKVIEPHIKDDQIPWAIWEALWNETQEYLSWMNSEPKGGFAKLPKERLVELIQNTKAHQTLQQYIDEDAGSSAQLSNLIDLEKTLLLQINLRSFLSSYVNFSHFYNPNKQSLSEQGSVLMDGRIFKLSVLVTDRKNHKERSQNSGFFLLYIQVTKPTGTMEIATAVTGEKRGDLHVGKKGVFIDNDGNEFPAHVVDILDNPINIREAFLVPFSSVKVFIQKRLEKFSSQHEKELESTVEKTLISETPSDTPKPPAESSAVGKAALLNGGVTFAALSSSFAYLIKTLSSIKLTQLVTVTLPPLLVVSVLSSVMAWWKLHRRDLGPILEASGWGINHPLYAPSWATRVFTQGPLVPKSIQAKEQDLLIGYQQSVDPYGRSKRYVIMILLVITGVLLYLYLHEIMAIFDNEK